jgi:hypothetical protein
MKRLGSVAIATALFLATAAPAGAEPVIWHPVPCATGEITEWVAGMGGDWPTVAIAGWIRPCPGLGGHQTNGFAVMHHTRDANFITALEPYGPPTAPTAFAMRIDFTPLLAARYAYNGGLRGLCLVRTYEHRLACVSVEWDADGTPRVSPLPPDDPSLQAPIYESPPGWDVHITEPNCGTCVRT